MNICIYAASGSDIDSFYLRQAERLGQMLAQRNHTLVFGGGQTGLMGATARGAMAYHGKIIGIAPRFFKQDGVLLEGCSEFIFTDTMRQRKQAMEEAADAFIVLPGGIGTLEEFLEIFTLKQLHRHTKPIALWNLKNYYAPLLEMLRQAAEQGFLKPACFRMIQIFTSPEPMLHYLEQAQPETE